MRHNFYSDTQTKPTPAMLQAIQHAELGDEQLFADPTTTRLEAQVAELLGKESAVFLPSGTMCNEIAIKVHTRPGDEVICQPDSHIIGYEGGGPAALSGVMINALEGTGGWFTGEQVRSAIRPQSRYAPPARLVSVEQTYNRQGGAVWPLELLDEVAVAAHTAGLATHMDGARLMNAVVAAGIPAARYAQGMDSVWLDLTKGLGAPVGAVLAGSQEFIDQAWRYKQQWGGAMRQSGVLAAMGLYALDHHVDRLAEDHRRAAHIGAVLAGLAPVVQVLPVDTNIVVFDLVDSPLTATGLADELAKSEVSISVLAERQCRIVTHLDVDDQDVEVLVQALTAALTD